MAVLTLAGTSAGAQRAVEKQGDGTIAALLVSDIHFDPFHDPDKVKRLENEPVNEWEAILASPDSPDQAGAFAQLQKTCHAKGVDTPYALLRSSLDAMRAQAPDAKFIVVSGDLIAHAFDCRFMSDFQEGGPTAYADFVDKTIAFVVQELRTEFPGVPVYAALGNNDTGCGDYRVDAKSYFLKQTAEIVAGGVPEAERHAVAEEFPVGGYYSVALEPLKKTRLVVLNDLAWSPRYRTCAGTKDAAAGDAELAWLKDQLAQARQRGERVWVMGHIPPGVNAYATVTKFRDVCAGEDAELFLTAGPVDKTLADYSDVVRLGLFGHTHMDEMRLLTAEGGGPGVPLKLVSSISPVDGNNPSFTVARVDAVRAELKDYAVFVASNQTGVNTTWAREYDYAQSYHEPDFSAAAVRGLIAGFEADPKGNTSASQEYIRHYFKGDAARELAPFWAQYACSLNHATARAYGACVCAVVK